MNVLFFLHDTHFELMYALWYMCIQYSRSRLENFIFLLGDLALKPKYSQIQPGNFREFYFQPLVNPLMKYSGEIGIETWNSPVSIFHFAFGHYNFDKLAYYENI